VSPFLAISYGCVSIHGIILRLAHPERNRRSSGRALLEPSGTDGSVNAWQSWAIYGQIQPLPNFRFAENNRPAAIAAISKSLSRFLEDEFERQLGRTRAADLI
jgi:hypothetical protein